MPRESNADVAHAALHGKAKRDHNVREPSRTSAKTDVFVNEFLLDPLGMKERLAEIAVKYKKRDGDVLELGTVRSWYSNWCSASVDEVQDAVQHNDWSKLKTAYYPAAVEGSEEKLLDALKKIAMSKV